MLLILLNIIVIVIVFLISIQSISVKFNFENLIPHKSSDEPSGDKLPDEVQCNIINRNNLIVALVFGQSNAANYGESTYASKGDVYVLSNGKCFNAVDPLKGTDGNGGSVWSRLGDKIIDAGLYNSVLFVPFGVGGSDISQWARDDAYRRKIINAINDIKANDFEVTHILFHQGETDSRIYREKNRYKQLFGEMLALIRSQDIGAPFYLSIATYCDSRINPEIQAAQRELVNESDGIYPGPDTDTITGEEYRLNNCHFTNIGLDVFSQMWLEVLSN